MPLSVEQIMECIENPTRTKIILFLQDKQHATAKEILAAHPGIPQATLYRSLKGMEAAGILEVVRETRVRAVTEKTYAVSKQFTSMEDQLLKENGGTAYYRMFSGFVLGLMKKFEQYAKTGDIDIAGDGSSFNALPIYATAGQLAECSKQIEEILRPLMTRQDSNQQLHTMAIIVTPPTQPKTEQEE